MAQDLLQGQDIATVRNEVGGEGMPQDVRLLSGRQIELCARHRVVEAVTAVAERAVQLEVFAYALGQLGVDGHHAATLALGVHELQHALPDPAQRQPLCLAPAAAGHQADRGHQLDVRMGMLGSGMAPESAQLMASSTVTPLILAKVLILHRSRLSSFLAVIAAVPAAGCPG